MIYLDNAATSWPKPDCVHEAMMRFMRDVGANPGRSGHTQANEAERVRLDAREAVAELFGARDPMHVIFTLNGTEALNLVIRGMLPPGSHVIASGIEHNAVMRPLRAVQEQGVSISIAPCAADGTLDVTTLEEHFRPETRLLIMNHASNVCGTVLPIREIGARAHERGVPMLVDAAQTGGAWPIDLRADNIDLLAFTGHKGLLGPTGTGGLVIGDDFDLDCLPPLVRGGTGSQSEHECQPPFLPDKYESGTPNIVGLAGLAASVRYVLERGVAGIRACELRMAARLIAGLGDVPSVRVIGTRDAERQTAVVSFRVEGQSCSDVAFALDERYGIMCRPGLHCAPRAHHTLGTLPDGTIRFAPGPLSSDGDIEAAVRAVAELAGQVRSNG